MGINMGLSDLVLCRKKYKSFRVKFQIIISEKADYLRQNTEISYVSKFPVRAYFCA